MTLEDIQKQDMQDLRAIFQTREGARFFANLIQSCGVFKGANPDDAESTHATAYREGIRAVGLEVLSWLQGVDDNAVVKIFEADRERRVTDGRSK